MIHFFKNTELRNFSFEMQFCEWTVNTRIDTSNGIGPKYWDIL